MTRFARKQLDAFRATLACGSLTRAAETLRLSQPAVTKLIAALEVDVGFSLFVRSRSGVTPTPEGLAFAEAVERHYLGLERLAQAADEIRDVERGHTRLATFPALSTRLLPAAVARFHARYPSIRVTMEVHTAARVIDLVSVGAFDIGFTHSLAPTRDVTVLAGYEMDCVVAMPAGHALAEKTVIEPRDLDGTAMVGLAHHTMTARSIAQMLLRHNAHPHITIDCQPSFLACALVQSGLGVAIVDPLTPTMLDRGSIAVRPLVPPIPFQFRLVTPAGATLSRATRALARAMVDHIDATPEVRAIGPVDLGDG